MSQEPPGKNFEKVNTPYVKKGGASLRPGPEPGALRKRTQEIVERCINEGVVPLEVMLDNMRFAHDAAKELYNKINDFISGTGDGEGLGDLKADFKMLLELRDRSQIYSRHAAPYIHPRLSAIEISGGVGLHVGGPPKIQATPAEAMAAYQDFVKNATDFIIPDAPALPAPDEAMPILDAVLEPAKDPIDK